jgi:hypothetical protein
MSFNLLSFILIFTEEAVRPNQGTNAYFIDTFAGMRLSHEFINQSNVPRIGFRFAVNP